MKKLLLVTSMFLCFAGVVSASSINGDYKGNPIVIVKSDGKQLETDEVPAMIYDGHTMVPISLLRQLGASVTWNQDEYSVNVKVNSGNTSQKQNSLDLDKMKVKVKQIDNYTVAENTAEYMQDFVNYLSLYFNGVNKNYANRMTKNQLDTEFYNLSQTVDKNVSMLNEFTYNEQSIDNSALDRQVNNIKTAYVALSNAKNSLANFESYMYTNPTKSNDEFDKYLTYASSANSTLNLVISAAHNEYLNVVNDILRQ